MSSKYNFVPEKEAGFLKNSEDYLRAVQERVAAFYLTINADSDEISGKVQEASELWYNLILEEASSFYNIVYNKTFKDDDSNFLKRKGFRTKNQFAFDLITNWVFERMIIPVAHQHCGLNCSPFYLNPATCDNDAQLGWQADTKNPIVRKINSNYDFLTNIGDDVHNIEIKCMFVHDRRSANFKTYCTPPKDADLSKYHVLFYHLNGLGNPKSFAPSRTKVEFFHIAWEDLIQSHIHFPPQIDGKPCYLVHLHDELLCEQFDATGRKNVSTVGDTSGCFNLSKPILAKTIRYDMIEPYLSYSSNKFKPESILKKIKNSME